jgi:hypothetical protein
LSLIRGWRGAPGAAGDSIDLNGRPLDTEALILNVLTQELIEQRGDRVISLILG